MVSNRCLMIYLNVVWLKFWEFVEKYNVNIGVVMMVFIV